MFSNLKVLEIASVLAGPAVGMFFAELGAEVTKIENALTGGDITRQWKLASEPKDQSISAYYCSVNWGKKRLLMNLKLAEDREKIYQMIADTDIVIVNFKAGDAEKLQMDYEHLKSFNSQLIYGEITAFGPNNPRVGFDMVLQAESGFLYMNGAPNEPPVKMPVALIDLLTAHQLKEGLLLALLKRERTGEGSYVTVSLFDAAIASLANQATNWLVAGHIPQPMGTQHPNIAPYGDLLLSKDGKKLVLAVGNDRQFQRLCMVLNAAHLADDKRFQRNVDRVQNRTVLAELLGKLVAQHNREELLHQFHEHQVPAGAVRNMQEVFEQEGVQQLILEEDIGGSEVRMVRTAVFEIK